MGKGEPMVAIDSLHHTYMRGTPLESVALRGVNLQVYPGEAVSIAGPAGSGKSTLAQHVNGLLRPSSLGRVIVDGQDLAEPQVDIRSIRQKVGLVFQFPEQQLFERIVGDDIAFGPRQFGWPHDEVRERVRWAMEMVGLEFQAFKDRFTFSLSGGERRRVALAGVLALRPKILVLDESTSGLDPKGRREFLARIRELRRVERLTLVFISNNMEDLASITDRLYILDGGRVVLEGPTRRLFGLEEELSRYGLRPPPVAQITSRLRRKGLPVGQTALTVEEAEEAAWRILSS